MEEEKQLMVINGLKFNKMIGFRDDLTIKDCTWDKVFGGNI